MRKFIYIILLFPTFYYCTDNKNITFQNYINEFIDLSKLEGKNIIINNT